MATRFKTVKFAMPTLAAIADNTLTSFTQRTLYLPESSKVFKSVWVEFSADDIITATGGTVTTKTFGWRLGAASYTSLSNTNALTHSAENLSVGFSLDMTAHFVANWSGASMTFDFRALLDHTTGTTLGVVNACATICISYEYDDTSATHVKSVMIPLNAPAGALTVGATTYDTFPALDTYCPEASKTFRDIFVVVQGNEHRNTATTDHTMTVSVGATTVTTGNYEGWAATDRWFRYVFSVPGIATNSTHNFQLHSSVARVNHPQVWAVVTYEFDPSTTTDVLNDAMVASLPPGCMGGTTSADFERMNTTLFIEEPGTITTVRLAAYLHWEAANVLSGINLRLGTGSFVAYTDAAPGAAGGIGGMVRNDAAFTLARGRNLLTADAYRTNGTNFGMGLSCWFLVNYTSGKAADGVGAHNHTVGWQVLAFPTTAASANQISAATAVTIPETDYYVNDVTIAVHSIGSGTGQPTGAMVQVEQLSAEIDGHDWRDAGAWLYHTDSEVGQRWLWSRVTYLFKRWTGDPDAERFNIETARRYQVVQGQAYPTWDSLTVWVSYHSIEASTISGTVSGYADADGAGLTVWIHRTLDGERIAVVTTTAGGVYTFAWYDDTEPTYAVVAEDATHSGASQSAV